MTSKVAHNEKQRKIIELIRNVQKHESGETAVLEASIVPLIVPFHEIPFLIFSMNNFLSASVKRCTAERNV
jgi:hypothetical protein